MANGLDSTTKYVKLAVLICTLLTIISGIICYVIANKVTNAISPITTRIVAAEEKLNSHIVISDKYHATITDKDIFNLTIRTINADVREIKLSQKAVSDKLDGLITILLQQNTQKPTQPGG